jgi:predicted aspartyl protease
MEISTMGKVMVVATIQNLEDLVSVKKGLLPVEQVRSVEIPDALVDTGASTLSMPRRLVAQLGLEPMRTRRARTSAGTVDLQVYGAVRLTIQDRDCTCDVVEIPDDCPVLIGQIPLEMLDFVVDPVGQRLIGNPAHDGEQMIELY